MGYLISRRLHFPVSWDSFDVECQQNLGIFVQIEYAIIVWFSVCVWFFAAFPFPFMQPTEISKNVLITWSATIQKQEMVGAGFAFEALDFLIPLASHVHLGWVNERGLNPFRAEDSAFHDLKQEDQDILRTIYKQGLEMMTFQDQILMLQYQPTFYEKYLHDYSTFKNYRYIIGRCMFETTSVPEGWVSIINSHVDEIWVPSKFQKVVFLRQGVKKPIVVIKEGFDPKVYNRNSTKIDRNKFFAHCSEDYVFIASSKWEDRKGWDILLEAFTEEFTGMERVCLAIRSTGLSQQLYKIHNPNQAKIIRIDKLSNGDYPSFYASADAFVLPSHGEGWGRTVMEAMAMALPAITTNWSGLSEFLSPEYSIPINITELEPAFPNEPENLGPSNDKRQLHKWARVDKYAVRGAMRWLYNNQEAGRKLGKKAELFAHSHYTREHIAEDIHRRILQIYRTHFPERDLSHAKHLHLLDS